MEIPSTLKQYLDNVNEAKDINSKWDVCQNYLNHKWMITLPVIAGEETHHYWIIRDKLQGYGIINLAIPLDFADCPNSVIVGVPSSKEVLEATGCELIATRKSK